MTGRANVRGAPGSDLPPLVAEPSARPGRALRRAKRAARARVVPPLFRLALRTVPGLYVAYTWLVFATSRVDRNGFDLLDEIVTKHDGVVALLWHEEIFTAAYAYGRGSFGFRPQTLASLGRWGELITRILERCGYVVFRGGSSRRASRRRTSVISAMIHHMKHNHNVTYGITVDGSRGPAYRMKPGGIVIARECGRPIALVRTWCRRSLRLDTWDQAAIPLPFNHIKYYLAGPYPVPEDAHTHEGLLRFRVQLEDELIDLAAESYRDMGQPRPENLLKRPPEERDPTLAAS